MNANQFNPIKSVKLDKLVKVVKISAALHLATAVILMCGVALPVQAEDKHAGSNWKIAKENVDVFLSMNDRAIASLFEYNPNNLFKYEIEMDEKTALQLYLSKNLPVDSFSFQPKNTRSRMNRFEGTDVSGGFGYSKSPDTIWTGAKRKQAKEYWTIIKVNLDKFIGMSCDEVISLLGPERCSSTPEHFIQYRIGDAGLTFYLKNGKVEKFRFRSDVYIPGT